MSVVNQMLKDLQGAPKSPNQLPFQKAVPEKKTGRLLLPGLAIIIALLYVFYLFAFSDGQKNQAEHDIMENSNVTTPLVNDEETIVVEATIPVSSNPEIESNIPVSDKVKIAITELTENKKSLEENQKQSKAQITTDTNKLKTPSITTQQPEKLSSLDVKKTEVSNKVTNIAKTQERNNSQPVISKTNNKEIIKTQSSATTLNKKLKVIENNSKIFGVQTTSESLQNLLAENSDFHKARLFLIKYLWKQNSNKTALELDKAVSLFPNQKTFRLAAAKYYFQNKNYEKSESLLSEIDVSNRNSIELVRMRAILRQRQNKHNQAISDYIAILKHLPNNGGIYIALGISMESVNKKHEALLSFKKALDDKTLSIKQIRFINQKINFLQG